MRPEVLKLILSIALDVLDFTVGRIPGLELPVDILLGVAAVMMWGWAGVFAFWEAADLTGQVDGFVPTLTLIALTQMRRKGKATARRDARRDGAGTT
jgi:hypothetical protein